MYTKKAKVVNPLGIHGRAASVFTHTASQFSSHVFVERADDSMKRQMPNPSYSSLHCVSHREMTLLSLLTDRTRKKRLKPL